MSTKEKIQYNQKPTTSQISKLQAAAKHIDRLKIGGKEDQISGKHINKLLWGVDHMVVDTNPFYHITVEEILGANYLDEYVGHWHTEAQKEQRAAGAPVKICKVKVIKRGGFDPITGKNRYKEQTTNYSTEQAWENFLENIDVVGVDIVKIIDAPSSWVRSVKDLEEKNKKKVRSLERRQEG